MIELLAYKDVPSSQYGFQWTVISEWNTQEEADGEIETLIELGNDRRDLKTRPKKEFKSSLMIITNKSKGGKYLRNQWNSGNPVFDTGIGKK